MQKEIDQEIMKVIRVNQGRVRVDHGRSIFVGIGFEFD